MDRVVKHGCLKEATMCLLHYVELEEVVKVSTKTQ